MASQLKLMGGYVGGMLLGRIQKYSAFCDDRAEADREEKGRLV